MKKNNKLDKAIYSLFSSVLLFIGIIFINVLADRTNIQWDMTDKKLFSLSRETGNLLDELENSVEILALYKKGDESRQITGILEQYGKHKNIRMKTIDPDRNPALLAPFIKSGEDLSPGTIIIRNGDNWKILRDSDLYVVDYSDQNNPQVYGLKAEQMISSAILYVKNGRAPVVCEINGHGERILKGTDIGNELTASNFQLTEANITGSSGIPGGTDIVVMTGPQYDISEYEKEKLAQYLNEGGHLFLSLGYAKYAMPNLTSLLKSFNINVENGLAMETDSNRQLPEFGDNPFFFIPGQEDTSIGKFIQVSQQIPFFAASIAFTETETAKKNLTYTPFLTTSNQSFLRYDLEISATARTASDISGPLDVGVLIAEKNRDTGLEEGTRIAVIGSPTALSGMGGLGVFPGNIKLLIGSLEWLNDQEPVFAVPNKSLLASRIKLDTRTALIASIIFGIILPLSIFITGFIIRKRRKNL